MKKNFISILLALCLVLSCGMFVGCNNSEKNPPAWQISKDEWQHVISTEGFAVEIIDRGDINKIQDGDLITLSYEHVIGVDGWNNAILLDVVYKDSTSDTNRREINLVKVMNSDGTFSGYLLKSPEDGDFHRINITHEQFDSHVKNYLDLINYVDSNYNKFSVEVGSYVCNLTELNSSSQTIAELNIEEFFVGRLLGLLDISYVTDGVQYMIYFTNPIEKAWNCTLDQRSFYIKGGPSQTDPEYMECYFMLDGGFRWYTPNNTEIPDRTDIYYKNNFDGTYTTYTALTAGGWAVGQATQFQVDTIKNTILNQYFGFMDGLLDEFRLVEYEEYDHGESSTWKIRNENGSISKNIGAYTYSFYDINIHASFNKFHHSDYISLVSYKFKFSQGQAESKEFVMAMDIYNNALNYPQV